MSCERGIQTDSPRSEPIRNVYRGDSSLVCRAFLVRPTYKAVGEIAKTVKGGGGDISLATVSKVLKTLQADLIVGRSPEGIRLIQGDKLLDLLAANYRPPVVTERYIGKVALDENALPQALAEAANRVGGSLMLTGAASTSRYAVLAREPVVNVYCTGSPQEVLSAVGAACEETQRFPNVEILRTVDRLPYFGSVEEGRPEVRLARTGVLRTDGGRQAAT